jgi:hypothetical protein
MSYHTKQQMPLLAETPTRGKNLCGSGRHVAKSCLPTFTVMRKRDMWIAPGFSSF